MGAFPVFQALSVFLFPVRYPVWGLPAQAVILCSVTGMRLANRVSSFPNSWSVCVVCFKELETQHLQLVETKNGGVQNVWF